MPKSERKTVRSALPWWLQITVWLVVFTAGGVSGAMVASQLIYSRLQYYNEHAGELPNDILPGLQRRLGLSESQAERVRGVIERRHPRMLEHRHKGAQAMLDEFNAMEQEIADVLDEGQKTDWHATADSVRRRFLPPAPVK